MAISPFIFFVRGSERIRKAEFKKKRIKKYKKYVKDANKTYKKRHKTINMIFHLNEKMCFWGDLQEVSLGLLH